MGLDLDPDAPLEQGADDARLLARVTPELAALPKPYVALVHLSNTHHPYRIDENEAPFVRQSAELGGRDAGPLENRYRDAIYHQDHLLADFLRRLRATPGGAGVVVLFVSDHGESFYEKGVVFHTLSVDDTEIHVPAWIDAPAGTLSDLEAERLRALGDTPVSMLDVLPTVLDLLGIEGDPAMKPFTARMPGTSLIGPRPAAEPTIHLTNCTHLWAGTSPNWGVMRGPRKYVFRGGDPSPRCYDVLADPNELHDLGRAGCEPLAPELESLDRAEQGVAGAAFLTAQ